MSIELDDITSGYSTGKINENFQKVEDEFNNNVLRRDGLSSGEANQMEVDFDMNSFRILNLPEPVNLTEVARLQDIQNAVAGDTAANLISFTPTAPYTSDTVQGAIEETRSYQAVSVETLSDLKALDVSALTGEESFRISSTGRSGNFLWRVGDQSANIANDPQEGVWVAPSTDATGASGAWERVLKGYITPEMFGAVGDGVTDDQAAFQAVEDYAAAFRIREARYLGEIYLLGSTVKYVSNLQRIANYTGTVLSLSGAFSEGFTPASSVKWAIQEASFKGFTFLDDDAVDDGQGSTSTKTGIDFTGTFFCRADLLKGVRMDSVCSAKPDDTYEAQHTRRTIMSRLGASNCNWIVDFPPAPSVNQFMYGDIQCLDFYNAGSIKNGIRCEDADGFMLSTSFLFPSGSVTCSGHYINILGAQLFEPRTENPTFALRIATRVGGAKSRHISVSNVNLAVAGRDFAGNNLLVQDCENFNITAISNSASANGARFERSTNGNINLNVRNPNEQNIENPQAVNSFDGVTFRDCQNIVGIVSVVGLSHRHNVHADSSCRGLNIAVTGEGSNSSALSLENPSTSLVTFSGANQEAIQIGKGRSNIVFSGGETAPSLSGRNGATVVFSNSSATSVTTIGGSSNYFIIDILLLNSQTTLLADGNGGNFVFKDGATSKSSTNYVGRFIRSPQGNLWVEM